ncbi:fungal-specific transcription factor domain-containing protein [Penicillium cataractarum]|uniref:Fungal-specific transcription factor domain-containing protein n=1 Tax=Penicillium cataractarum TaxID=2100454 RepID=A0A9W9SMA3_9EURO|nr:fungal-specific transcription factor domain-containing protein [Penicillium cataractarum]KAJ5381151.1 fungal-specific transcription factor domain-containing protein [Penicillium cataractarum]
MTDSKTAKRKPAGRRTHLLGACKTCRKRHVKCDQTKPICKACKDADVVCETLISEIQWVGSSTNSGNSTSEVSSGPNVRRQLYTEKERKIMSSALVSELATFSIDQFLAEIDTQSKDAEEQNECDISMGPFSVFNLNGPLIQPEPAEAVDSQVELALNLDVSEHLPIAADASLSGLSTAEEVLGNLDTTLQWADIFSLDPSPADLTLASPISGYNDLHSTILFSTAVAPESPSHPKHDWLQQSLSQIQHETEEGDILSQARTLLKHFHEHVVTRIIWLPMTQKSPWTIMMIPASIIALDQLTYMGQSAVKHAGLANLYAILACASYHLAINPGFTPGKSSQYWEHITITAYEEAKQHIQRSLENELEGPNKAKYKEQLMAMLSLTTFAILSDNQKHARCHIINMEYLIRLRGLVKPHISRRARLLHHMYTWLRILTESTLVVHNQIPHSSPSKALCSRRLDMEEMSRLAQRHAAIPPFDRARDLDDFLRVTPAESDRDLNIDDPKDSHTSLGDIHLIDSRNVADGFHLIANGVSETWLSLLSQTTRLANVMDRLNSGKCVMTADRQLALHRRSLYLENMTCAFASRRPPLAEGDPKTHMLQALNSALVIYFYRRVRQVNPCILQGYVTKVLDELHEWDAALTQLGWTGPGTAWPAFMAGCEAMDQMERQSLVQWLDNACSQSGFTSYSKARVIMEEVWKQRDACYESPTSTHYHFAGPMSYSWMDFAKENIHWLLLF